MMVGPFDNEGKVGLKRAYEPEVDDAPPSPQKSYDGKERKVAWRATSTDAPYHGRICPTIRKEFLLSWSRLSLLIMLIAVLNQTKPRGKQSVNLNYDAANKA